MAKKSSVRYSCSKCGGITTSWAGKCGSCGEWNTLIEQLTSPSSAASSGQLLVGSTVRSANNGVGSERFVTGMSEIDDILGGGVVRGSIVLIAGEPGIGKSTLLMQIADSMASTRNVLYVSGEESAHQVASRAIRLGAGSNDLEIAASNSANDIARTIMTDKPELVVVDSIQTVQCDEIGSSPGSVSQITNSTHLIASAAKKSNTAVIFVGHVTKEGSIAGPKVLEHVVDVVLQLEGDRYGGFKILRSVKNRYGSTMETGIFEMGENGLKPVSNPSAALLAERQLSDGSVVLATMEGTRPLLVEVQALVSKTSYGYPKRTSSGFDLNRLNLLVAVIGRRTKLDLSEHDVYLNIVGGIKISEPAADLAVIMSLASAARAMQLSKNAVVFGEVGLSGEVRHVPFIEKRVAEAKKMGFETAIGPRWSNQTKRPSLLTSVKDVRSALNEFLSTTA